MKSWQSLIQKTEKRKLKQKSYAMGKEFFGVPKDVGR